MELGNFRAKSLDWFGSSQRGPGPLAPWARARSMLSAQRGRAPHDAGRRFMELRPTWHGDVENRIADFMQLHNLLPLPPLSVALGTVPVTLGPVPVRAKTALPDGIDWEPVVYQD